MDRDLVRRVTGGGALALLPLAGAAAYAAGFPAFLGVLAGGVVAFGNFRWLSMGSHRALSCFGSGRVHPLWLLALGLRHLALFVALGVLLWSGYVHPLGLIVGLSVFPPMLIVQGLRGVARTP